ncbi:MAG: hypothetical protein K8S18_01565, partial [Desulfobacula sp.]|nr:hypothetical protein [Desulfobacula sp.]
MIHFFSDTNTIIAVESTDILSGQETEKLEWLFSGSVYIDKKSIDGFFVGPRKEMITPWSTNAVEITQNMAIEGIVRIEEYFVVKSENAEYDPMLQVLYDRLCQDIFRIDKTPEHVIEIDDISDYSNKEGLALSKEEIKYLDDLSISLGRKLTDGEVFGFSQV